MKKILSVISLLLFATLLGQAQSSQRIDTAFNVGGKDYAVIVPLAKVYVCTNSTCAAYVPVYNDAALTQRLPQPLTANSAGVYFYYASSGTQATEKICGSYGQCTFKTVMIGPLGGGSGSATAFQVNGTPVTSSATINFQAGSGVTITNPSNGTINFTVAGTPGTVTAFTAPAGSWPSYLTPTVTNGTTTPQLTVSASAIPNSALQNSSVTVGSTAIALGGTATSVTGLTVDGVSPTTMAFVDPTSSIQTQLNAKAASNATLTLGGTTLTLGGTTTAVTGLTIDGVSPATMAFVDATSSIQTQLNGKQAAGAVVGSINGTSGAFTFSFSAGAGSCTGTTCNFTGSSTGGGTVTNFVANSASWPSWIVPTVTNGATTPTLAVALGSVAQFAVLAGPQGGAGAPTFQTTLGGITIDGVSPTTMGFVDPTSSIQTQLNGKASSTATFTLGSTSIALGSTTTSVAGLTVDGVSPTTMAFVDPTSSIQTQLNGKAASNATLTLGSTVLTLGVTSTSVTGLTVDGVSPATMAFVDPTSSIQTQLNSKQANLGYTPAHAGANSDITSLTGLTTPLAASEGGTGATSLGGTLNVTAGVLNCSNATSTTFGCIKPDNTTITISAGVISAVGGGGSGITQLTGDVTAGPGSGSQVATLATVNAAPGVCGDSTHVCQVTTNGKGLVTGQTAVAISSGGSGTITGVTAGTWLTGGGTSGTVTLNAKTQRGTDAVVDLGMDNTGATDNSTKLQNYFNSLSSKGAPELHFPCGTYYFHSQVTTNANLITIIGDGQASDISTGCVTIETDQALSGLWWFDQSSSSSNLQSVRLEHLTFTDNSTNHNLLKAAVRITNQANIYLQDVGGYQIEQQIYTTGTVSVTQGSKTVTGSGTTWTSSMLPGFLWVNGYPYEINTVNSATSITLFTGYQGSNGSGLSYSLDYGGIVLWGEPGLGFTQYGSVVGLKSHTVSVPVYMSSGTGSTGTSRIKFLSGYVNCGGLTDSMAAYFGNFSDTMEWHISENSCSIGTVAATSHQNDFSGADFENAGSSFPPVTTCNGGVGIVSCTKGTLIVSDNSSNTYGNRIIDNYYRQVGNAIELVGISANPPTQTKIAYNTFRSNTNNCVLNNATNTAGECDGTLYAAGGGAQIQTNTTSNTDIAGQLTLSTGTASYTFAGTYASAPICTAVDTTAANAVKVTVSTTTLTITGTGSDVVNYVCVGRT